MPKYLKIVLSFFVLLCLFVFSGHLALANADDLILEPDGSVILVLTNPVLAASTDNLGQVEKAIEKIIQVAPARAQNTVEIDPKPTKDQKINVTIKSETKPNAPARQEKRTVDQIVAQGVDKKPIFTIKSDKSNHVTISQGNVQAATPLPLTIDTRSKGVSTKVGNAQVKIQVLPKDAVKKVEDNGLVTAGAPTKQPSAPAGGALPAPTITLQAQNGEAVYNVSGERQEKLFNVINLAAPVTVSVSAQSGRTVRVNQPVIFNVIDFLTKGTF